MKLKGIIKKLPICLTIIFILSMLIMPFHNVFADNNQTYYDNTSGVVDLITRNDTNRQYKIEVLNENVRAIFYINENRYCYNFVSLSPINNAGRFYNAYNGQWITINITNQTSWNGNTFYRNGSDFTSPSNASNPVGIIAFSNVSNQTEMIYRCTFGDLAIGPTTPVPPIQAGDLSFNYYTDFASTQQNNVNALKSNRDTITWDYDTTDSNIPGIDLKVDIRAVPTKYYSSTEDGLDSLTWGDLSIDSSYAADLGSYQMNWNNRQVSFTWEEVVDSIKYDSNLPDYYDQMVNFWNFKKRFAGDYWYWTGWVYQIRLNTYSGDYTGEWQTIYQISSAPPEGSSETINYYVTGTGLTEPVYQTIQNVNNQNNIINNTWYVNGNPFDVNGTEGDNWLTKLLELILDAVFGTLGKLIDAITDLLIGSLEAIIDFFKTIWDRFLNLFDVINFTNDNQEYDLDIPNGESFLDIIPAFIRGMSSAGISYMIWIPLVVGIIFMVL